MDKKLILVLLVALLFATLLSILFLLPEKKEGYLTLNNETMICDYYYICFFFNNSWHKPKYNAGTNLIAASKLKIENETAIKDFFKREKINLVLETTPGIVETMPFAYYLSYYYNIKNESKKIVSNVTSQWNYEEPAIIILGPNREGSDTIKYDGKNLIVDSKTRESLGLLLGKLLLIVVS